MKTRFWIPVLLLIVGAALAGYWSGHYEGVRTTRIETQQFLRQFVSATDLETYLQAKGQSEWAGKLRVYGIGGPGSYVHSLKPTTYAVLAGVGGVAAGMIGLLALSRKPYENRQANPGT